MCKVPRTEAGTWKLLERVHDFRVALGRRTELEVDCDSLCGLISQPLHNHPCAYHGAGTVLGTSSTVNKTEMPAFVKFTC